LEHSIGADRCR